MDNCIFCKIIKGEMPSYKVYEDKKYFAFLDIIPDNKGHTLVVPKKHYQWVYDVPEFGEYWETALKITRSIQKTLRPHYVSYQTFGIQVPHAHIHIKPRYDQSEAPPEIPRKFTKKEFIEIAGKMRNSLK